MSVPGWYSCVFFKGDFCSKIFREDRKSEEMEGAEELMVSLMTFSCIVYQHGILGRQVGWKC